MNQTINPSELYKPSTPISAEGALARVLDVYWTHPVAIAPQVSLEILEKPEILTVPGTKNYIEGLMRWQNRWIPAINLKSLLTGTSQNIEPHYCLVVLYRYPDSLVIEYGALILQKIATTVTVTNSDFTALPESSKMWSLIADSCFSLDGQSVPILNMQSLFCYRYDWDK